MSSRTINAFVLALSVILALAFGEWVARAMSPWDPWASLRYRIPDARFGWVLEPGARYLNRLPEEAVPVEYSPEGWRDVPHTSRLPVGARRVVVLGDSFMEAYSVHREEALPARLQALLAAPPTLVDVVNLGVGGYGTLQEYLVFDAVARELHPDVVVLAMFLDNDLRNNSRELEARLNRGSMKFDARPFLEAGADDAWEISTVDVDAARWRYAEQLRERETWWSRLRRHSGLMQLIGKAFADPGNADAGISASDYYLTMYGAQYCDTPPEYATAWTLTRRILERLDREVRAAGASLVVMAVPAVHSVDPEAMARVAGNAPTPGLVCLEDAPAQRRLGEELAALGIPYLDLLPAFRAARRDRGVDLFRRSDDHWNPAGHDLAARRLAAFLSGHGLLAPTRATSR